MILKSISHASRQLLSRGPGYFFSESFKNDIKRLKYIRAGKTKFHHSVVDRKLQEAIGSSPSRSDISDHLSTLFFFANAHQAQLVVELGTRGGESTRSLLAAASIQNAQVISVDIDPCEGISIANRENWHFVQADDVEFGENEFSDYCRKLGIQPQIDLLFIDTSHEYEHTVSEIKTWSQHLADNGLILFHDTNMGNGVYARLDGSVGIAWDNNRGVIRAIEEWLGRSYDENTFFCDITDDFSVLHFPNCNGLTILKKRSAQ